MALGMDKREGVGMGILLGAGARKRAGCVFLCVVLVYATSSKKVLRPFREGDPGHKEAICISNLLVVCQEQQRLT